MLLDLLEKQNMSIYRLSKDSGVPYTTVNDLIHNRTDLMKSNVETVYKLSKAMNVEIEELIKACTPERITFDLFRSNVCQELKNIGDFEFIKKIISNNLVKYYLNLNWNVEALYILGMLDYLCARNNIPLYKKYNSIRRFKLTELVIPSYLSVLINTQPNALKNIIKDGIPEFLRFNILEKEIDNVA